MSLCSAMLRDDGDCPVRPSVAVTVGVGKLPVAVGKLPGVIYPYK